MLENFKDLSLEDKSVWERITGKSHGYAAYEYSFNCEWIWDSFNAAKVYDAGDFAIAYTKWFDKIMFFPPLLKSGGYAGAAFDVIEKTCAELKCGLRVNGLEKADAESFAAVFTKTKYRLNQDRGEFDYVYSRAELAALTGKKFHSKRNLAERFRQSYEHEFRAYRPSDKDGVLALFEKWRHDRSDGMVVAERSAILRALSIADRHDIKAAVLESEGKIIGFTLASVENDNMAHVLFKKGDGDYEGIYQYINRVFAERFLSGVKYVNRMEDMNIEGLRRAKMSYNPVLILEKYSITEA